MGIQFHIGALLLAIFLVVVAVFAYRGTTPSISTGLRALLTGLRVTSFALIAFLLMDPRYILKSDKPEPAHVVALIDRSASMSLPTDGWAADPNHRRFDAAETLASDLGSRVRDRGGRFTTVYFSGDLVPAQQDTIGPDGQGTDIERSLQAAYKQHEGDNLTAFIVFSDGANTENRLVRETLPDVPVYTVGLGDTSAAEDVRIKEVDYNSIVRAPSRTTISASVAYSGNTSRRVRLRLLEGRRVIFEKDTVLTSEAREFEQKITVEFPEPGRRQFVLEARVDGEDMELENNRRDIVIEAEKAGVRILIVDMLPSWEVHFLTDFMRRDETFDFSLVSTLDAGRIVGGKLKDRSEIVNNLGDYDAIVVASVDDELFDAEVVRAITVFVREEGKGLLVLPGQSSLFEVRDAWGRMSDLLPVSGSPPLRFNLQFTSVRPGAQASTNPITAQLVPLLSQTDWQQRSPLLGYYSSLAPKTGVEVLLETTGQRAPVFVYQTVGKGRVALLSVGPLWRWKFLAESNTLYDEMVSRLLDVLSRGEDTERFMLVSGKSVYDSGEKSVFTAEIFNEKMQPVTGVPVRLVIARIEEDGSEVPLEIVSMTREGSDNTRFKKTLSPLPPGDYRISGEADVQGRTIRSQPVQIAVSEVSVEFHNVRQDRDHLERIARRSRGEYVTAVEVSDLADRLRLEPRMVETTYELSFRTSTFIFVAILLLLGTEWMIRKRAGMI